MTVWFEGSGEIECSIEDVGNALDSHGELFAGVGMTSDTKPGPWLQQGRISSTNSRPAAKA
jgi:hypothetical protein